MKLPRGWWLVFPALGVVGGLVGPAVYAERNIPAELRNPEAAAPSVEGDLACAVEAACGPLRAAATLTFRKEAREPTVDPPEALPPGYAACAARVVDGRIEGVFALAPCARPAP